MNGNIISLFVYYWVFILGALVAIKAFDLLDDSELIPVLIVMTVFYFAFQYIRGRAKQRQSK